MVSQHPGTTGPAPLSVLHGQSESSGHTAVKVHHEASPATTSANSAPLHEKDCTMVSQHPGTTGPAPLSVLHVQSESSGHTAVKVHHEASPATTSANSAPLHEKDCTGMSKPTGTTAPAPQKATESIANTGTDLPTAAQLKFNFYACYSDEEMQKFWEEIYEDVSVESELMLSAMIFSSDPDFDIEISEPTELAFNVQQEGLEERTEA
ncbi:hypothetical protein Pcinc_013997 [Petrolisthes cinctipes]|uniref:Uncharacterized protein n=1 Tax=Petrolisthes cinctipes TaxID=88211 RepID=A0AAE1FYN5_PETCI|nr:hypothetical protein Pcinc_013997 [Petrolisthes cinctipes]